MRKQLSFLAKASGFFGKAHFKRGCLRKASSLHGAAPSKEGRER
jgi:hypothetical protein